MLKNQMTKVNTTPPLDRSEIIRRLADFRKQWEQEAGNLCDVRVSLGMALFDIVALLELDQAEQGKVLGSKLYRELVNRL